VECLVFLLVGEGVRSGASGLSFERLNSKAPAHVRFLERFQQAL